MGSPFSPHVAGGRHLEISDLTEAGKLLIIGRFNHFGIECILREHKLAILSNINFAANHISLDDKHIYVVCLTKTEFTGYTFL